MLVNIILAIADTVQLKVMIYICFELFSLIILLISFSIKIASIFYLILWNLSVSHTFHSHHFCDVDWQIHTIPKRSNRVAYAMRTRFSVKNDNKRYAHRPLDIPIQTMYLKLVNSIASAIYIISMLKKWNYWVWAYNCVQKYPIWLRPYGASF